MAIKDKSSKPKEDGAEEETSTQKQPFWVETQVSEKLLLLGY